MMFFKSRGSTGSDNNQFIPLVSLDILDEIETKSQSKPVFIFKHSTRCGISSMVWRRFQSAVKEYQGQMECYYLDLLSFREISNAIASRYEIVHQSPQLIVIKNEIAVAHSSHYDILEINFQRFV